MDREYCYSYDLLSLLPVNSAHIYHNLLGHILCQHFLQCDDPNCHCLVHMVPTVGLLCVLAVGVRTPSALTSSTVLG